MQKILLTQNKRLQKCLNNLIQQISQSSTPKELDPYRNKILGICEEYSQIIENNIKYLSFNCNSIIEDLTSNTFLVTRQITVLSTRLSIPLLRSTSTDRLSLRIINAIHQEHPKTITFAPAFTDGETAIWPGLIPIYFLPCIEQRGLLFQPLLFHEFGHLLYYCHKPELDDIVKELQFEILNQLNPSSVRNDRFSEGIEKNHQVIAETWYSWAQEFFCDVIGLLIGGPSFLHAFSRYLNLRDASCFYRQSNFLSYSSHPVNWSRIKFLSKYATTLGFDSQAIFVESEWSSVANILNIAEEYHGFFDDNIQQILLAKINDMLIEVDPHQYNPNSKIEENAISLDLISSVLNKAWEIYLSDSQNYYKWEEDKIHMLLTIM